MTQKGAVARVERLHRPRHTTRIEHILLNGGYDGFVFQSVKVRSATVVEGVGPGRGPTGGFERGGALVLKRGNGGLSDGGGHVGEEMEFGVVGEGLVGCGLERRARVSEYLENLDGRGWEVWWVGERSYVYDYETVVLVVFL